MALKRIINLESGSDAQTCLRVPDRETALALCLLTLGERGMPPKARFHRSKDSLYPWEILIEGGREIDLLRHLPNLEVATANGTRGEGVGITELLEDAWVRARNTSVPPRPPGESPGWILLAKDDDECLSIAEALFRLQAPGLSVAAAQAGLPGARFFRFDAGLRLVSGSSGGYAAVPPPLSLLKQAAKAWWGPVACSGQGQDGRPAVEVFLEWPWKLRLRDGVMEGVADRLAEMGNLGVVLISRDAGPLRFEPGTFRQIVEAFESADPTGAFPGAELGDAAEEKSQLRIEVRDLRLVEKQKNGKIGEDLRTSELRRRRNALDAQLERLGAVRGTRPDPAIWGRDPLFVYFPLRAGDGSTRPQGPLLNLARDWWHDREAIEAIHVAVAPKWGALNLTAYLVTTARSLEHSVERGAMSELAAQILRSYPPVTDPLGTGATAFELLPEWTAHGLRIFVENGWFVEFSPELRPSREAAERVAKLLLPSGQHGPSDRRRWLVLVSGGGGNSILVKPVPVAVDGKPAFTSLPDRITWETLHQRAQGSEVAVELAVSMGIAPAVREGLEREVEDGVARALGESVQRMARQLNGLEANRSRAETTIKKLTELANLTSRETVDKLAEEAGRFEKALAKLLRRIGTSGAEAALDDLQKDLVSMRDLNGNLLRSSVVVLVEERLRDFQREIGALKEIAVTLGSKSIEP